MIFFVAIKIHISRKQSGKMTIDPDLTEPVSTTNNEMPMKHRAAIFFLIVTVSISSVAQDAGFDPTVRFIQHKIRCCSIPFSPSAQRKVDSLSIASNGDMTLHYSDHKPPQSFNLLKLYKDGNEGNGMDTLMKGRYIQFYINPQKINLIHFATAADAKETFIALQKLFLLCKTEELKSGDHSPVTKYFVDRNAVVTTANEMLLNSIRCLDNQGAGDTSLVISSRGEGWLDKDSLPVGQWNFYTKDASGKEYLFKSGIYSRTTPDMFEVKNIDSSELADHYHLTFYKLQQDHVHTVPFIKSGNWNYYQPNGEIWKRVNFRLTQIPVNTAVSVNADGDSPSSSLLIQLKENMDEWVTGDNGPVN